MKISTKGRYALRLMLDLALRPNQDYISLKAIAQRQGLPDKYLEQIIQQLSKAGLVESARGSQGGYRLSRTPEEYSVGEILRTVEGSLSPVACLDWESPCDKTSNCLTIGLYRKIQAAVASVVDNTTLADMLAECHRAPEQKNEPCQE